jgi:hypothetical protein
MMIDGEKSKIAALKGYIPKQIKIWYKMGILFIIGFFIFDVILIYTNNITDIQSVFVFDVMIFISVIIVGQLMKLISRC